MHGNGGRRRAVAAVTSGMIRGLGSVEANVEVEAALTDDERKQRLDDLTALIDMIRPAVQQDGGDLILVEADVENGEVDSCHEPSSAVSDDVLPTRSGKPVGDERTEDTHLANVGRERSGIPRLEHPP